MPAEPRVSSVGPGSLARLPWVSGSELPAAPVIRGAVLALCPHPRAHRALEESEGGQAGAASLKARSLPGSWRCSPSLPGGKAPLSRTPHSAQRGMGAGTCRTAPLNREEPEIETERRERETSRQKSCPCYMKSKNRPLHSLSHLFPHQCLGGEGENNWKSSLQKYCQKKRFIRGSS